MGFLSYNLSFYDHELKQLERHPAAETGIYRARQLLRMLDDLTDEGYTELNTLLEKEIHGVSRLQKYLKENHAIPFRICANCPDAETLSYSEGETELNHAILNAVNAANGFSPIAIFPFADSLGRFCQWIGYDADKAYIFLLRDTLLPFVYYLGQGRTNIHPWLLGRKSFAELTGNQKADDEIRASIYRALEAGYTDCKSFFEFVLPDIKQLPYIHRQKMCCARCLEIWMRRELLQWNRDVRVHFPCFLQALTPAWICVCTQHIRI